MNGLFTFWPLAQTLTLRDDKAETDCTPSRALFAQRSKLPVSYCVRIRHHIQKVI